MKPLIKFNRNHVVSTKHKLLLAILFLGFIMGAWLLWLDRPRTLSIDFKSDSSTPSIKQMQVNGHTGLRASVTGRSETGGAGYAHRFTDRIDFRVLWYDLIEERAWQADFSVYGRELSTFGEKRHHAVLHILVGPGADVLVSTFNREAMRLIGLRRDNEMIGPDQRTLPQYQSDVILRELCATPFPVDDEEIQFMIHRATTEQSNHIRRAFDDRRLSIERRGLPEKRCSY